MLRWRIAILLTAAIAISYLDRQTLPVAIKAIGQDIPLTNVQFSNLQSAFLLAYALMYAGGGKLADALGTRRGFTVIMIFWSIACASHGLALTFTMLAISRFALGMGEGGGFPASTRAVAEWFSVNERATAMGIINAGSAVGAVVAPQLIALILFYANWRWIFFFTSALGLLWTVWWHKSYFPPADHPQLTEQEREKIPLALASNTSAKKNRVARSAPLQRNLGHNHRKISKRRRLVLLSLLASQISLRRAPLRHQIRRRHSLDPQRGRRHRLPRRRRVLQLSGPPKILGERRPQTNHGP
jgi:MFS family permease